MAYKIRLRQAFLEIILLLSLFGMGSVQPVQAEVASDLRGGSETITFAVITDFGTDHTTTSDPIQRPVAEMVLGWNPDFIVTAGDSHQGSSYTAPPSKNNYAHLVGGYYGDYLPQSPSYIARFWPTPGNHDHDVGIDNYAAYFGYLPPAESGAGATALFYDFFRGPVHFFMMNSGTILGAAPDLAAQQSFLETGLEASDAAWKIVIFHKSPYTGGLHGDATSMQWPFGRWGADFVITGHNHIYERIHRDDIVYFTAGTAGNNARTGTQIGEFYYGGNDLPGAMRVVASDASITFKYISQTVGEIDSYTQINQGPATPTITTSGSLGTFVSQPGVPSPRQSYTVSGANLVGDLVVTPPDGFQISALGGGAFASEPINLSPDSDGALAAISVHVRLYRETDGVSSGNVSHVSRGATTRTLTLSGTAYEAVDANAFQWIAYYDLAWAVGSAHATGHTSAR